MSEIPFHATVQGRRFFEGTLPKLVEQLEKLNARLAALAEAVENSQETTRRGGDESNDVG